MAADLIICGLAPMMVIIFFMPREIFLVGEFKHFEKLFPYDQL